MYRAIWFRVKIKWKQNKEQIADENTIHVFKFEHRQFIFAKWVSIDTYAIINDDSIHYSDANECAYAIPKMLKSACFGSHRFVFHFQFEFVNCPRTAVLRSQILFELISNSTARSIHICIAAVAVAVTVQRLVQISFRSLSALARKFMITFGSFHVF